MTLREMFVVCALTDMLGPVIVFILTYLILLQDCEFRMIMDLVRHAPRARYLTNLSPGLVMSRASVCSALFYNLKATLIRLPFIHGRRTSVVFAVCCKHRAKKKVFSGDQEDCFCFVCFFFIIYHVICIIYKMKIKNGTF